MSGRVEAIVARLHALHPRLIDLSLHRLEALLARLGHPERRLPPVIHVAGTNGKGSVCAFLRAIGEASGRRVHVYTSPHLVRFNERFRLAGALVDDAALEATLAEAEAVNAGAPITVFEMITAAGFMLFARVPADLLVLEVGLGGRFDATNVVPAKAAAAITSISLDHREFLGETLAAIAFEKAGIIAPEAPAVTGTQAPEVLAVLDAAAAAAGTRLSARGREWTVAPGTNGFEFRGATGTLALPSPGLLGRHQVDNAAIAVAALRAARLGIPDAAMAEGVARATWPARLQRLTGRLARRLPPTMELWLDGGHNPGAGAALADQLDDWAERPTLLVVGMKQGKDAAEFLRPLLARAAGAWAVAEPEQHLAMPVDEVIAAADGLALPGPTIAGALDAIAARGGTARVLICGSLFLAGEVLKQDGDGV